VTSESDATVAIQNPLFLDMLMFFILFQMFIGDRFDNVLRTLLAFPTEAPCHADTSSPPLSAASLTTNAEHPASAIPFTRRFNPAVTSPATLG
jgi:hypothetical protein